MAFAENGTQYHYVKRQAMWTVAGLLAMMGAMHFDYGLASERRRVVFGLLA